MLNDEALETAYANWHCAFKTEESKEDYNKRSWLTAENYIRQYPEPAHGKPLFVIVTGE